MVLHLPPTASLTTSWPFLLPTLMDICQASRSVGSSARVCPSTLNDLVIFELFFVPFKRRPQYRRRQLDIASGPWSLDHCTRLMDVDMQCGFFVVVERCTSVCVSFERQLLSRWCLCVWVCHPWLLVQPQFSRGSSWQLGGLVGRMSCRHCWCHKSASRAPSCLPTPWRHRLSLIFF